MFQALSGSAELDPKLWSMTEERSTRRAAEISRGLVLDDSAMQGSGGVQNEACLNLYHHLKTCHTIFGLHRYFVLIPRTLDVPCKARRVFKTLHDNQEQASIHILYDDSPIATENHLLGQFDLIHIPAAPKEVPQIEVSGSVIFVLTAAMSQQL